MWESAAVMTLPVANQRQWKAHACAVGRERRGLSERPQTPLRKQWQRALGRTPKVVDEQFRQRFLGRRVFVVFDCESVVEDKVTRQRGVVHSQCDRGDEGRDSSLPPHTVGN